MFLHLQTQYRMPRKNLIKTSSYPYQITNRSNNKEFFYISTDELWEICTSCLYSIQEMYSINIHMFVLMSNHYHLIIDTPKENISEAMRYFHCEVARAVNKKTSRMNHVFGGRYKWCLIDNENYYWNAIKYNFRNPVEAGLSASVESYAYSSLNTPSRVRYRLTDFFNNRDKDIQLDLEWLNEKFDLSKSEAIKCGLRRRNFRLPTISKKLVTLETPRYEKGTGT